MAMIFPTPGVTRIPHPWLWVGGALSGDYPQGPVGGSLEIRRAGTELLPLALLFAQYLDEQLLLTLPQRQFVSSIPKALRIFFRHGQRLFAAVSFLIFSLLKQFYRLVAASPLLTTAAIVAFQPFGDFLRPNAHWHSLVLAGGFAPGGRFLLLPIHDTQKLSEAFRRAVIKLLLSKALISEQFASTLFARQSSAHCRRGSQKACCSCSVHRPRPPVHGQALLSAFPGEGELQLRFRSRQRGYHQSLGCPHLHRRCRVVHPPRRVFGLFTTSVCILPAGGGSGPSGLMWFLTPPRGGRRIAV